MKTLKDSGTGQPASRAKLHFALWLMLSAHVSIAVATSGDLATAEAELASTYADTGNWKAAYEHKQAYAGNAALAGENNVQRAELLSRERIRDLSIGLATIGLVASLLLSWLLLIARRNRRILTTQSSVLTTLTGNLADTVMLLNGALQIQFANRPLPGADSARVGRPFEEEIPQSIRADFMAAIANVMRDNAPQVFVSSLRANDHVERFYEHHLTPVLNRGKAIGITLRSTDFTEHHRFEERLRAEAQILDTMNEGVLVLDQSYTIRFANEALHILLGHPPYSLINQSITMIYGSDPGELWDTLSREIGRAPEEVMLKRAGGSDCLVSLASSPLPNTKSLICVCRDISGQRRIELEFASVRGQQAAGVGSLLHEGLAQGLAGVSFLLSGLSNRVRESRDIQELKLAADYLLEATQTARELARRVSPTAPTRGSLGAALIALCAEMSERLSIPVECEASFDNVAIETPVADQIYQIAEDLIHYAIDVSDCESIEMTLECDNAIVTLHIGWQGAPRAEAQGLGDSAIRLLRYRAQLFGGWFDAPPIDAGGGEVIVSAPLQSANSTTGDQSSIEP